MRQLKLLIQTNDRAHNQDMTLLKSQHEQKVIELNRTYEEMFVKRSKENAVVGDIDGLMQDLESLRQQQRLLQAERD